MSLAYISHHDCELHDMGPHHPERPARLSAINDRLIATGLDMALHHYSAPLVRRELLEAMGFERIKADGYAFQIEMNFRFVNAGARIKEIPFFFLDRVHGESKLTWQVGFEALWIVWWLRIAQALGRL